MELPRRDRGDELLRPGELTALRQRLRTLSRRHEVTTVIACAFDHRTRMLPFLYADVRMAPAGVRAIGAAMVDAGFDRTRLVLGQWNRHFRPSQMRLEGRVPDLFMVSSMQIHAAHCEALIRDASRIDAAQRPLIIAGGPRFIYQPWEAFSADPNDPWGADVAVTGEEYVLLSLLEAVLEARADNEPLRAAFVRARDRGGLDGIPGLVYARGRTDGVAEELVDTGVQRLVGDLDELPDAVLGYRLLEPPGRKALLGSQPLAAGQVRRATPLGLLVTTFGCTFSCPYCPIPAYNQRQHRFKSGQRIAEEMDHVYREFGIRHWCLSDDNFFDDKRHATEIIETLVRAEFNGLNLRSKVRWVTEVTVHGTLRMADHLTRMRKAGCRALWVGVEDMTATLVQKGQGADKTLEAFALLHRHGICAMPMMMHHDEQPLYTRGSRYGLLNQVKALRRAGAISLQVLMQVPAPGSRLYEGEFESGQVLESAAGRRVEPHMFDGSYVVSSKHANPWRKQLNLIAAYAYFYNPLRLLLAVVCPKNHLYLTDSGMQILGMWGLAKTVRRTIGWAWRLMRGPITRGAAAPASTIPMRGVDGQAASHALPGTPVPK
ncbi:MAG: radical SAM protein [Planctomycetes bacterium]|nr:radical SAM protein [Planctomycetota bacterium]